MFIIPNKKASKYRNVKTEIDGILFDSMLEAGDYQNFKLLQAAGEISQLALQVPFELDLAICRPGHLQEVKQKMTYIADFTFIEKGQPVVYESKGVRTWKFNFKWKLVQKLYPEWEFRITPKTSRQR